MPSVKIGIPPFVIGLSLDDLHDLGRAIRRVLRRPDVPGVYRIVARHSAKCLDIEGASTENCARTVQPSCHGGANQQWLFVAAPAGFY